MNIVARLRRHTLGFVILAASLGALASSAKASDHPTETLELWAGSPPGSESWRVHERQREETGPQGERYLVYGEVGQPTLTVIRPRPGKATGASMIVLPGGAFMELAWTKEGLVPARWLAERGVTVFVLKYRVREIPFPSEAELGNLPVAFDKAMAILDPNLRLAIADARQAVRIVRENAGVYGLSKDRVGLMGFSAGATTAMDTVLEADGPSRPNLVVAVYGAMEDRPVPPNAPPVFVVAAQDDEIVPVEKSVDIFQAWQRAGASSELHIYRSGGHGFGFGRPDTETMGWPRTLERWLASQAFVAR